MCGRAAPLPFWVVQCFQSCAHAHRLCPAHSRTSCWLETIIAHRRWNASGFYQNVTFLCACLPVLFPSQHSQQDHTSRCGYGDPDQRERIPCLGHSRRRCGRTGRRAPAPPEGVPEEEDVSAEELLVPPEGAEEEEPPLSAPAFGCANTYRLRCVSSAFSRPSAVLPSAVFSPQGLRDTAAFWLRQSPGEVGTPHSARRAAAPCRHPAARNIKCRKVNIFIAESARHRSICRVARIHRLHLEMRAGRHCVQPCRKHGSLLHCPPR